MKEPIKEMLPAKDDDISLDRNYTDLPLDVGLWPSIIINAFITIYNIVYTEDLIISKQRSKEVPSFYRTLSGKNTIFL